MAIVDEIERLEDAADIIKTKTAALGLDKALEDGGGKVSSSDTLDIQARAIDEIQGRTPVTQTLNATTTSVSLPQGYYGGSSSVSVSTMSAPTVNLSGTSQTISCNNKMMNGDIVVPAANVYRTGSEEPTSSTPGNNGDLYMVI